MTWNLSVWSKQVVSGWRAEAVRLRGFLEAITAKVGEQHQPPLLWEGSVMTIQQWRDRDMDQLTAGILEHRGYNEDEGLTVSVEGPAMGAVGGHLGDAEESLVISSWSLRGDSEWQFGARQTFYTDNGAKALNEYPLEWLCGLVVATAENVEAADAQIHTMSTSKVLRKVSREARGKVGLVNLVPNGIGDARIPGSVTVVPCESDVYPNGVVLAVDLDAAVNDPVSVIDDMLAIYPILTKTP